MPFPMTMGEAVIVLTVLTLGAGAFGFLAGAISAYLLTRGERS